MNKEALEYHIQLSHNNTAKYALLPGDPDRVQLIASFLENPEKIAQNREYTTYQGYLCGEKVLVTSTGIGGPSAAIALEELNNIGVDTVIRIGTCGGMQLDILSGDTVIATGAVRMDGTSKEYVPIEFPAVANFDIVSQLVDSAAMLKYNYHCGIVQSKDSFYGQHSPETMPSCNDLYNKWNAWIKAGVLASEMECSTLFTVASIRKIRAGAVLLAVWNQERANNNLSNPTVKDTSSAIQIAINALKQIIIKDKG